VQPEVLGITLWSNQDLEMLLTGFNVVYNGRRQRVLKGRSPDMALRERLKAKPELAKLVTKPPDSEALPKALKVAARAQQVLRPDSPSKCPGSAKISKSAFDNAGVLQVNGPLASWLWVGTPPRPLFRRGARR
jgi:hypothetical protein